METANLLQPQSEHALPWHLRGNNLLGNESRFPQSQKKRNPVGNLDNVAVEKENMKQEVESYPDGMLCQLVTSGTAIQYKEHKRRTCQEWGSTSPKMVKVRRN
jgi:hypothetical protein